MLKLASCQANRPQHGDILEDGAIWCNARPGQLELRRALGWGHWMIRILKRGLRQFGRDEKGIVLILFTLMFVPILLIVAVAVDVSQTLVVKRQLISAVDAAALTVAQMPNLSDDEAEEKTEDYIKAHYPDSAAGSLKGFSVKRDNGTVDISATAELSTSFLRVAGYDTLSVTVNSRAMMKQTKLEVVMVLDNTGSMSKTVDGSFGGTQKIDALKTAAGKLIDILFAGEDESDFVKVGLVPFANAVNVGKNLTADQLDTANPSLLNTEHVTFDDGGTASVSLIFDTLKASWRGCVRARTEPYDLTDDAPDPANKATLFTPYFAPDENVSSNSYLTGPSEQPFKNFTFYRDKTPAGGSPNYDCPQGTVEPLTNVKSTITTAIGKMTASGSTVIPEGLAWGWRLVSPGAPFALAAPYDDKNTVKAVILLTDGQNNLTGDCAGRPCGPHNDSYKTFFSAYGYASKGGHLGAADGSEANAKLDEKTATVCSNITGDLDGDGKGENIILYTITFGVLPDSAKTLMENCASPSGKYFHAPSDEDLQSAFETIAYGLSKLRLAR
jgi:Flp pilus assembly protein TadG